jgi:hypothetical protein
MTIHTVFDKTLRDTQRRDVNLREPQIESVLPEHYLSDYPKFVTFLKKYYDFESRQESLTTFLDNIFDTRDVTSTDLKLLEYFEDEYLLGQNYFQGFTDKRTAAYAKYAINTFLATKVVFFNQLQDMFGEDGFDELTQLISMDERIGKSHMMVPGPDRKYGFGGMCFPKDTSAFVKSGQGKLSLLKKAIDINKEMRDESKT